MPRFVYHPHVAEAFIVNGGTIAFGDENKRGDAWVQKHDAFAKAKRARQVGLTGEARARAQKPSDRWRPKSLHT